MERLAIPVGLLGLALIALFCFANLYVVLVEAFTIPQAPAVNAVMAKGIEQVVESLPVYEPEPVIESVPLVEVEPMVETIPQAAEAIEQVVEIVTPGTKFGNIELPAVDTSRSHAHEHPEYPYVRRCYENPGDIMMYRERHQSASYKFMYHILCQSKEDGKWYDRLIFKIKDVWYEETGFLAKDGSWQEASKWLQKKGVERIRQLPLK